MDAKKLSEELKEQFSRITPEDRVEMDKIGQVMEKYWGFYHCKECHKDSSPSTPGQKTD